MVYPLDDFLLRAGLTDYTLVALTLYDLLNYLETGDLPIGSTVFMYFLWFKGFNCCLLDMSYDLRIY